MLIYRMAGWGSAMFSPHCFNADTGDFISTAMGTGPFYIADRKDNEYTVLKRYVYYYGVKAKAKSVRIKVIPSPETRYSAMKSGEVHGVIDLGGLTPIWRGSLLRTNGLHAMRQNQLYPIILHLTGAGFLSVMKGCALR